MTECSPALQVHDLAQRFDQRTLFCELNFELPKGALCALLGTNGVGKSSLLRVLAGSNRQHSGKVQHQGRLGFVPQEVNPGLPLTAHDMVLLGRARQHSLFGAPDKADYQAVEQALARVRASHLAARLYTSLSGGERQLVLMARALAGAADVLLLDEPMAAMDWHNQALILNLLRSLSEQGVTVLLSTHVPQHALEFCSHALLLHGGNDYAFGAPHAVMTEEALSRLYHLPVRCLALSPQAPCSTAVPVFTQPDTRSC